MQPRSKRFDLFLLARSIRFQLLNLVMSFEKLIEQHCVHLVVAHAVGFSFFIAHHQVGVYPFYLFGHKSELRCACCIDFLLVAEGDWLQRKEYFASLFHWFNRLFKASRGGRRAKLAIRSNEYGSAARGGFSKDTANIATATYVGSGDVCPNADNVTGRGYVLTSTITYRDIVASAGVVSKRIKTDGIVANPRSVATKCIKTEGIV